MIRKVSGNVVHKGLAAVVFALFVAGCAHGEGVSVAESEPTGVSAVNQGSEAPSPSTKPVIELFVMSQCPYGAQAVVTLAPAIESLGDLVDFKMYFVGTEVSPGVLTTLHGDSEIVGNAIFACAQEMLDRSKFLALASCMSSQYVGIPGNLQSCAQTAQIDPAPISECANGQKGYDLLAGSFKHGNETAVLGSPTIRIDHTEYSGPRTGVGLLREVCRLHEGLLGEFCASIPKPTAVKMTILSDKRCADCDQAGELGAKQLINIFPGLSTTIVDYATDQGKSLHALVKDGELRFLPAFFFGKVVQDDPSFAQIAGYFTPVGDYFVLAVDSSFDPTAEICDNGADDNGNGQIDCKDPGCRGFLACRNETALTLDLFVMSMCPYGIVALNSMKEVLEAFGGKIKFSVHYIAGLDADGGIQSLHGQPEVSENIRQLCAAKYYSKGGAYLDFIWCRNKDIESDNWQACATGPIKAKVIAKCASSKEGLNLLKKDLEMANELGIGGSPTWLINNKNLGSALSSEEIKLLFCLHNKGTTGCEKSLSTDASGMGGGGCGR